MPITRISSFLSVLLLIPGFTGNLAIAEGPPPQAPAHQPSPLTISPPISQKGRGHVAAVAFSPDGKVLATGNGEGLVRFYDPVTARERAPSWDAATIEGVKSLAYSPDGKTLAVGVYTRGVMLLDVATREPRLTLRVPPRPRPLGPPGVQSLTAMAYSPDGKALAGANAEGQVAVWDVMTGRVLALMTGPIIPPTPPIPGVNLPGRPARVTGLTYCPDGRSLATMGHEKVVRVWDPADGRERFAVPGAYPAYSPDGSVLAIGAYRDAAGRGSVALLDPPRVE
jgi:WD40 repeat protein